MRQRIFFLSENNLRSLIGRQFKCVVETHLIPIFPAFLFCNPKATGTTLLWLLIIYDRRVVVIARVEHQHSSCSV